MKPKFKLIRKLVRTSNAATRLLTAALLLGCASVSAQVTFFEHDDFQGQSFNTSKRVSNLSDFGFNDLASSVLVLRDRWEVCEHTQFTGRCVVLRPGRYPSLSAMGLNDRVSSVRAIDANARVDEQRYAPLAAAVYDNRRRNNERLFQADVTAVRAIVGAPEQRCWVEPEQASQAQRTTNVPGAVVGALIGGILGHQVGGGSGKDLATVGGAIVGGAVGAQVGRNGSTPAVAAQNVQRCTTVPSQNKPELWDVSYVFRGQEHRVQMTSAPGSTISVNRNGEPRA